MSSRDVKNTIWVDLSPSVIYQNLQHLPVNSHEVDPQGEVQLAWLKSAGNFLIALLLQYSSRVEGGEAYLEEGQRMVGTYAETCAAQDCTLSETVHAFFLFRRSILDLIFETGQLGGSEDYEGMRLFRRTNEFFDALTLSLISSFRKNMGLEE